MKIQFKKNKKSLSPSYTVMNSFFSLNEKMLKKILKNKIKNNNISRLCLHSHKKEKLHFMIILQNKGYSHPFKKHPYKDKYYILLSGKQNIRIIDNKKKTKNISLSSHNFICKIPKNVIHSNMTKSKDSIHIEIIGGPFNKLKDTIYL